MSRKADRKANRGPAAPAEARNPITIAADKALAEIDRDLELHVLTPKQAVSLAFTEGVRFAEAMRDAARGKP